MKTLIKTLSVLTLATTTGNLTSFLNTTLQETNITTNYIENKTQQDTIYVDKDGKQITTSERDLSNINSKEVIQIGFFKNNQQIQVVTMPETIEKVPKQLPPEITSLREMFIEAKSFNQDISTWNTSHVTDMAYMFYGASVFNKNISSWNTSNVTDISYMFTRASAFNQNITLVSYILIPVLKPGQIIVLDNATFHKSKATKELIENAGCKLLFLPPYSPNLNPIEHFWFAIKHNIKKYYQIIDQILKMPLILFLKIWINITLVSYTSKVINMSSIFFEATSFNKDLSTWNTSNVTNMNSIFNGASAFNNDLSKWNTLNVKNMHAIFCNATTFNKNLSTWNTSKVTSMDFMFYNATTFNENISKWNTKNVTNMNSMFYGASSFNQDLSKWNVNKVTSHEEFAIGSQIDNSNKLPKFKN